MKTIKILELDDTFDMEDWCRPLYRSADFSNSSDTWLSKSTYSGTPCDHLKWAKVKQVFGNCWQGKTLREYFEGSPLDRLVTYEFIRGEIPDEHILKGNYECIN
jgi:hypothetical protein